MLSNGVNLEGLLIRSGLLSSCERVGLAGREPG